MGWELVEAPVKKQVARVAAAGVNLGAERRVG